MNTIRGHRRSPVFVVAVIAHAHSVERQVGVLASRDLALLAADLALGASGGLLGSRRLVLRLSLLLLRIDLIVAVRDGRIGR